MSTLRFDGRTAIVTGAGQGIGNAYARLLASRGARVVVNDVDRTVAEKAVAEIVGEGGVAVADDHDISLPDAGEAIVERARESFGGVDIVVNNAGITTFPAFAQTTAADWQQLFAVNFFGAVGVSRAAWPHMAAQGYGRIVSTSSPGVFGFPSNAPYSAAKAAILGFTTCLAAEGREVGINANAILPMAYTRMTQMVDQDGTFKPYDPDLVAPMVGWLVHEECDVTGEFFCSGGGFVSRIVFAQTEGFVKRDLTVEDVRTHYDAIAGDASLRTIPGGNGGEMVGAHVARVSAAI